MIRLVLAALPVLAGLPSALADARRPSEPDLTHADHLEVERVMLLATVLDRRGRPVLGLEKTDFRVFENDRERSIEDFFLDESPLHVAIVLDTSHSMLPRLEKTKEAALSFVNLLRPGDQALVVDFDEGVYLLEDLTSDREAVRAAVSSTSALGGTALFDALHACFRRLAEVRGRKAVVLLSDGDDTVSQIRRDAVLEEARRSDILVYAIGLGKELSEEGEATLRELARETGGRPFFVRKAKALPEVYAKILEVLRHQYNLSYSSDNRTFDGRWMAVRLVTERKDLRVLTRAGYYAARR